MTSPSKGKAAFQTKGAKAVRNGKKKVKMTPARPKAKGYGC